MTDKVNPFKPGSRKAEIYDVFLDKGLDAASKRADKLGIKPGTVKSWSGAWVKGTLPVKKTFKEKSAVAAGDKVLSTGDDYEAHFKHTSIAAAEKHRDEACKRSGLRAHAFHILENEGRFALVPVSYRPIGPLPQFKKGDVVYDPYIANSKARVTTPGPEQTEIRYDKDRPSRPRECAVPNRYLIKLPDEPVTSKPKREKIEEKPKTKPKREKL